MRLLSRDFNNRLRFFQFRHDNAPPYAILSHTWGAEEVTFEDIDQNSFTDKLGYKKIELCLKKAISDGINFCWVDTCCINKEDPAELTETINSMFRWYQDAEKCYVYLSDITTQNITTSKWFTRGWTLQELLAPPVVEFFNSNNIFLGTKESLIRDIHERTRLPLSALRGRPLTHFTIEEKLSWMGQRETTHEEDTEYSMAGILEISMTVSYGEGRERAHERLLELIRKGSNALSRLSLKPTSKSSLLMLHEQAPSFVGRGYEMERLINFLADESSRSLSLYGPGGIGKTELVTQFSYWIKRNQPEYSVFWLSASSDEGFRTACADLLNHQQVSQTDLDEDPRLLMKRYLSLVHSGQWLLVIDAIDDVGLYYELTEPQVLKRLVPFIPKSIFGKVIFIYSDEDTVAELSDDYIMEVGSLETTEAIQLFRDRYNTAFPRRESHSNDDLESLVRTLSLSPLAIIQASLYMTKFEISVSEYIRKHNKMTSKNRNRLYYPKTLNKVETLAVICTVWAYFSEYDSELISTTDNILNFMTHIEPHAIPLPLLSEIGSYTQDSSWISVLLEGGFLLKMQGDSMYYMHRLVQIAIQLWLGNKTFTVRCINHSLAHMQALLSRSSQPSRGAYMPHAMRIVEVADAGGVNCLTLLHTIGICLGQDGRINEFMDFMRKRTSGYDTQLLDKKSEISFWELALPILPRDRGALDTVAISEDHELLAEASVSPFIENSISLPKWGFFGRPQNNSILKPGNFYYTGIGAQLPADFDPQLDSTKYTSFHPYNTFPTECRQAAKYILDDLVSFIAFHRPNEQTKAHAIWKLPSLFEIFAGKFYHQGNNREHQNLNEFLQGIASEKEKYDRPHELELAVSARIISYLLAIDIAKLLKTFDDVDGSSNDKLALLDNGQSSNVPPSAVIDYETASQIQSRSAYKCYMNFKNDGRYSWLLHEVQTEIKLSEKPPTAFDEIRAEIIKHLWNQHDICRRKKYYEVSFTPDWNPILFLKVQKYKETCSGALSNAITLTGTVSDAQSATTSQYLSQTWPCLKNHLLNNIIELLENNPHRAYTTSEKPDKGYILSLLDKNELSITTTGPLEFIIEIAQQIAWLGASLRTSECHDGVVACKPTLKKKRNERIFAQHKTRLTEADISFRIDFKLYKPDWSTGSGLGNCWQDMFRNPTLVEGFPIRRKDEQGVGLELPLSMAARLVGARQIDVFNEKIFMKGFSTMLVAVKVVNNMIVWHYLFNADKSQISYIDSRIPPTDNIELAQVQDQDARHVIGWCTQSRYLAGNIEAEYDVGKSNLPKTSAGCLLEKISITAGHIISGSASFAVGVRESAQHFVANDYVARLDAIHSKYFLFWDEQDKRAWLVNGTSALLHIVLTALKDAKRSVFADEYRIDPSSIRFRSKFKADSAARTLINVENRCLTVYDAKYQISRKFAPHQTETEESSAEIEVTGCLWEDYVSRFLGRLEQILAYQQQAAGINGINIKPKIRKHLEGWDFCDIATNGDALPRIATLQKPGFGWVDFVRAIGAITLFGRGFGEIIQPAERSDLCEHWSSLPKKRHYLAVSNFDLRNITDFSPENSEGSFQIAEGLVWYCPREYMTPCSGSSKHKDCDPVQIIRPAWSKVIMPESFKKQVPELRDDSGAYIFGHSMRLPIFWSEKGGSDIEPIAMKPDEVAKGKSRNSDVASESCNTACQETMGSSLVPANNSSSNSDICRELYEQPHAATNNDVCPTMRTESVSPQSNQASTSFSREELPRLFRGLKFIRSSARECDGRCVSEQVTTSSKSTPSRRF